MRTQVDAAPTTTVAGRRIALVTVCLGFALIQLDATIVNVALPTVQHDLGGTLAGLQWTLNGYTVALAAFLLTAGSLADRLGGRRVFLCGLAVFCLGSAACAAAAGLGTLIAARVVQGVGAAALLPASLALLVHQFPGGAARARALGVWGAVGSVGLASGPVLGGVVVADLSWRLIFLINVPVGIATAVLVRRTVTETPRRPGGIDPGGVLLGVASLAGVVAGFIEAGQAGWSGVWPTGLLAAGVVAGALFVVVERRVAAPMLPLRLFWSVRFSAATAVGLLFNLCLYGALLCLSLYLQQSRGMSPLAAGLALLPMTVVIGIGATMSGRLTASHGPRRGMVTGMCVATVGAALLALIGPGSPLALVVLGSMVLGLCSLTMPAMTAAVVGSVPAERAGLASGVLNASRQSGGALGVALLGALLNIGRSSGLHVALAVTAAGYAGAAGLSWLATRD